MTLPAAESAASVHRYVWRDEDRVYGFVDYYLFDQICMITHTEVDPSLQGRGYGSQVAGKAIEHVRSQGKRIVPVCGFMAHYLRQHPQHFDMVTPASRHIFNIGKTE